ncbi:MAG: fatty acid desaturase [Acidobacteriota bacterium]
MQSRDALRRLAQRSSARALLAIAVDWVVIAAAAVASERWRIPGLYAVAVIVIARQMNALFELHHHAMHGNLFRGAAWNSRLQMFYSLPLGATVAADRADHMEHHRTFNTVTKDYQDWGTGYGFDPARRGDRRYMIWFLCLRPLVGLLQFAEIVEAFSTMRVAVAGFWVAVIAAFLAVGRLDLLFWYWIVPRFTVYPILFFWDDMLGHYNCPRTGTREMRGLWFRIFSTHGTNFHNVHHLQPAIPFFNMERATRLAVDETRVDVACGFVDGMRQLVIAQE